MKQRDIMDLMDSIAPVIAASFAKAMVPVLERLANAEAQAARFADIIKAKDPQAEMEAMVAAATDPEAVRAMIVEELAKTVPTAEAVAALIPPAVAGKDADPEVTARLVKDAVATIMTPFQVACDAAIADVKAVGEAVEALPRPADGKSVTLDEVRPLVDEAVAAGIAALPPPRDGKDVDAEAVTALVVAEVGKAVSALPPAENGKDADPAAIVAEVERQLAARPGPQDGKSVYVEELRPLVDETVLAVVAAIPPAKDGKDVEPEAVAVEVAKQLAAWPRPKDGTGVTLEDCLPALQEAVAKAVAALPAAKDGVGLAGALLDQDGALVVTLTDGSVIKLGRVIGKAGVDGLGFEDLEIIDGEMTFTVRFARGDQVKEFVLAKPTLADMHKGVWQAGLHKRGTVVTWGGSQWLAMVDTEAKPETSKDWVLVVKRGRDGKDGIPPEPKAPAKVKLG